MVVPEVVKELELRLAEGPEREELPLMPEDVSSLSSEEVPKEKPEPPSPTVV